MNDPIPIALREELEHQLATEDAIFDRHLDEWFDTLDRELGKVTIRERRHRLEDVLSTGHEL